MNPPEVIIIDAMLKAILEIESNPKSPLQYRSLTEHFLEAEFFLRKKYPHTETLVKDLLKFLSESINEVMWDQGLHKDDFKTVFSTIDKKVFWP
jgi:hypothetical protein